MCFFFSTGLWNFLELLCCKRKKNPKSQNKFLAELWYCKQKKCWWHCLLLLSLICSHTRLIFSPVYSGGRQTLDAVSTCTISWQHTVLEKWKESTSCHSCASPALLWHIFETLYLTNFFCPSASEGWACGQLMPAWRHQFWGASKLTSFLKNWHEDKWTQSGCSKWRIVDIILPLMISHHVFYYLAIYLSCPAADDECSDCHVVCFLLLFVGVKLILCSLRLFSAEWVWNACSWSKHSLTHLRCSVMIPVWTGM